MKFVPSATRTEIFFTGPRSRSLLSKQASMTPGLLIGSPSLEPGDRLGNPLPVQIMDVLGDNLAAGERNEQATDHRFSVNCSVFSSLQPHCDDHINTLITEAS